MDQGRMQPLPNNTRYLLELERGELLEEMQDFEEKYGTFSFAFVTSFQAFALLAYLYIAATLILYKKSHSKINTIISLWALINFFVLLVQISQAFGAFDDAVISALFEMTGALGRSYGTSLSVIWLYLKYVGQPKPKYNVFMCFLILLPTVICTYYIFYYFYVNKFIYEVYGPGSDIADLVVYILVLLTFIFCKIFADGQVTDTPYPLLVSLVNLITFLPICLFTIYSRFILDIGWTYRYKIYFAEFIVNIISSSNAFVVLFLVILYNENVRTMWFTRKNKLTAEHQAEQVKMMDGELC